LVTEKAVADQVDGIYGDMGNKIDKMVPGTANNVVTSTAGGEVQRSGYEIGEGADMDTDPTTASLTKLPNERQVAKAIENAVANTAIYWETD
jgi:hypothetical protein